MGPWRRISVVKEPLAFFVWFQPRTYLWPFDVLPEGLDKQRRCKINVVNDERVVTFMLIPLVTPNSSKIHHRNPIEKCIQLGIDSIPVFLPREATRSDDVAFLSPADLIGAFLGVLLRVHAAHGLICLDE
jgi:hypothetical protein